MNNSFVRWSGIAAIVAGLFSVATSFNLFGNVAWIYQVTNIATLITLVGLYLYKREKTGTLWLVGLAVAAVGAIMLTFDIAFEMSGIVYALGLVIIAIAALRADLFPRWVPWMFLGAVIVGIPGFFLSGFEDILFQLGAILFALGFVGVGLALWRS